MIRLNSAQVLKIDEALDRYHEHTVPNHLAIENLVEDILAIVLPKEEHDDKHEQKP